MEAPNNNNIIPLGNVTFHADKSELISQTDGSQCKLEPRVADVLSVLAATPEQTVSKETLRQLVWGEVVVTEDSLNRCISILRKSLRQLSADSEIKTYPKKGFALHLPEALATQSMTANQVQSGAAVSTKWNWRDMRTTIATLATLVIATAAIINSGWFSGDDAELKMQPDPLVSLSFQLNEFDSVSEQVEQSVTYAVERMMVHPAVLQVSDGSSLPGAAVADLILQLEYSADQLLRITAVNGAGDLIAPSLQVEVLQHPFVLAREVIRALSRTVESALPESDRLGFRLGTSSFLTLQASTKLKFVSPLFAGVTMREHIDEINRDIAFVMQDVSSGGFNGNTTQLIDAVSDIVERLWLYELRTHPHMDEAKRFYQIVQNTYPPDSEEYQLALAQEAFLDMLQYRWIEARRALDSVSDFASEGAEIAFKDARHQLAGQTGFARQGPLMELVAAFGSFFNDNAAAFMASAYKRSDKQKAFGYAESISDWNTWYATTLGAHIYLPLGHYDKALELLKKGAVVFDESPQVAELVVNAVKYPDTLAEVVRQMDEIHARQGAPIGKNVFIYDRLYNKEVFLDKAAQAAAIKQLNPWGMDHTDPDYICDPRYLKLLTDIGLKDYWAEYGTPERYQFLQGELACDVHRT